MAIKLTNKDGTPVTMAEATLEMGSALDMRGNTDGSSQVVTGAIMVLDSKGEYIGYINSDQLLNAHALCEAKYANVEVVSEGEDEPYMSGTDIYNKCFSHRIQRTSDIVVDTGFSTEQYKCGRIRIKFKCNDVRYQFTYDIIHNRIELLTSNGSAIATDIVGCKYASPIYAGNDSTTAKENWDAWSVAAYIREITFDNSGDTYKIIFKIEQPQTLYRTKEYVKWDGSLDEYVYGYECYYTTLSLPISIKYSLC